MKRLLLLLAALSMTVVHGWSAPTAVTGTITGADGLPYANGTISVLLTNASGVSYDKLPYNPQTASIPIQSFSAPLDSTGSFAIRLAPNSLVTGSFWTFTGCDGGNKPACFTYLAVIGSAPQSLSAPLSAAAIAALTPASLSTIAYVNKAIIASAATTAINPAYFGITLPTVPAVPTVCTYYLSTTGSDAANGTTPTTSWLTFAHAEATATSTSSICVSSGTYTGTWTSSHTLKWYAINPGQVIVAPTSGSYGMQVTSTNALFYGIVYDSTNAGSGGSYVVYLQSPASGPSFYSCTFQGGGSGQLANNANIANVTVVNSNFYNGASTAISTIYGQYTNLFIYGGQTVLSGSPHNWLRTVIDTNTITVYGHMITGSGVTASNGMIQLTSGSTDTLYFINNTINVTGPWQNLLLTQGTDKLALYGNTITYGTTLQGAISVQTGTAGPLLVGNTITQTSDAGVTNAPAIQVINATSPVVTYNSVTTTGAGDPIDVHSTGTSMGTATVKNNTVSATALAGHGIIVGTDASGGSGNFKITPDIENNTVYGPRYYNPLADNYALHGIIVGFQHGAKVWSNKVYGAAIGIVIKSNGEDQVGTTVAFNYIANSQTASISSNLYAKGASNTGFYNNTVYLAYTSVSNALTPCMQTDVTTPGNFDATNNVFQNNICYVNTIGAYVVNHTFAATAANNLWNYNAYVSTTNVFNTAAFTLNGTSYTFATWQAQGQDLNSFYNVYPLFTNPALYDFSLLTGSPLLHTGVFVLGINSPSPNIGAWQTPTGNQTITYPALP